MRPSLQQLSNKLKGKTVFIIGGGTSVKKVDFSLLHDKLIVCINDAYLDFPNASVIYWVDETWASENSEKLKHHKGGLRFTSMPESYVAYSDKKPDPKTICDGYVLKRTGEYGYDPRPDCLMGNNSGVQVLNLIVNMEPKNIVLIGYDMKSVDRKTHYHDKPRLPIKESIYTDLFIPSMNALAQGIKNHGCNVNIVNDNPDSAIRCFKIDGYLRYVDEE